MAKRKVYYFHNPKTLSYERVYPSFKERTLSAIGKFVMSAVVGSLVVGAIMFFIDSPEEVLLKKENSLLSSHYKLLDKRLDEAMVIIEGMQERDNNLYRVLFMADPISSANRADLKNSSRYNNLRHLPNAEIVLATSQKMDALARRLYVQSKSFDDLLELAQTQEERLQCIPAIQPIANKDLKQTASGYGMRMDPIYRTPRFHAGMDFNARVGTDIYATGNGSVEFAGWRQGYGNTVIIDHGFGYKTLYAHMHNIKIREGQKVSRGEVIGTVGNTGKSTGPHLHYEVLVRGKNDNPAKYYFMDLSPEEYDRMFQIAESRGQVMD